MEQPDLNGPQKRQSLRNSVLKQPDNERQSHTTHGDGKNSPYDDPGNNFFGSHDPSRDIFGGIRDFFGRHDGGESFSPFGGFGVFGNMDRFEEHFNEMMERFFTDFQPESFADSQYYREDRDLDEDVNRNGLDHALQTIPETYQPHHFFSGFSHSESTVTHRDGSVEKRVTHKSSDGNTTTTVTIISPDGREVITNGTEPSYRGRPLYDGDARHVPPNDDGGGGLFRSIYDNLKRFF